VKQVREENEINLSTYHLLKVFWLQSGLYSYGLIAIQNKKNKLLDFLK